MSAHCLYPLFVIKSTGEKNKQLQVNNKKSAESADTAQGLDHAKKLFARQRAKDFAEHAKVGSLNLCIFNVRGIMWNSFKGAQSRCYPTDDFILCVTL